MTAETLCEENAGGDAFEMPIAPIAPIAPDRPRRVRVSRERRETLLAEFDGSGLSAARFAEMAGVRYPTFAGWLHARRRQRQDADKLGETPIRKGRGGITWVEAVAGLQTPGSAALKVYLPGGAWMKPGSKEQLRAAAMLLCELERAGGGSC